MTIWLPEEIRGSRSEQLVAAERESEVWLESCTGAFEEIRHEEGVWRSVVQS